MHQRGIRVCIWVMLLICMLVLPAEAQEKDSSADKITTTAIGAVSDNSTAEKPATDKNDKEVAVEKAIAEKMAADKDAAEKAAAVEKAIAEKAAADKAVAEKAAAIEKANAEKEAAEKAAAIEKANAEKEAVEKAAAIEKANAEKAAAEKAAAIEKANAEKEAVEKAAATGKINTEKEAVEKAAATEKTNAEKAIEGNRVPLAVNSSRILNLAGVERIAVANPEIADVIVISGSEVMLVGKTPGTTTMHIWTRNGRQTYTIEVGANDTPIASEIKRILGLNDVKVTKAGKTVILEGTTSDNYQRLRAEKIASAYAEKVVNLLEITQPIQVKIEAKVIEINKTKEKDLGVLWGNDVSSPGAFSFGQSSTNKILGNSLGKLGKISEINGQLSALINTGAAKILSQPSMVTLSGESANILVGGEIPIPTSNSNGLVTVEWKEYGIKLEISPEVNSRGLINSKVKAEVSALDWSSSHQVILSSTLKIPPLTTRKAETNIALSSGQTMVIGGLISRTDSQAIVKLPLLGDLPVLGRLFTSKSFNKDETELVILITPTIVDPADYLPNDISVEMKKAIGK